MDAAPAKIQAVRRDKMDSDKACEEVKISQLSEQRQMAAIEFQAVQKGRSAKLQVS